MACALIALNHNETEKLHKRQEQKVKSARSHRENEPEEREARVRQQSKTGKSTAQQKRDGNVQLERAIDRLPAT